MNVSLLSYTDLKLKAYFTKKHKRNMGEMDEKGIKRLIKIAQK